MTTTPGYDRPLYILPFDHRGTFQTKMFGWKGALTAEQTAEIAAMKQVIYDGFQAASRAGCRGRRPASSWTSSSAPPSSATRRRRATRRPCPAEKSGQDEFDFEYGDDFAAHIEAFHPTFCQGPGALQPRGRRRPERPPVGPPEAAVRLPARQQPSLFMFELLVPPEPAQLERVQRRQEGLRPASSAPA